MEYIVRKYEIKSCISVLTLVESEVMLDYLTRYESAHGKSLLQVMIEADSYTLIVPFPELEPDSILKNDYVACLGYESYPSQLLEITSVIVFRRQGFEDKEIVCYTEVSCTTSPFPVDAKNCFPIAEYVVNDLL